MKLGRVKEFSNYTVTLELYSMTDPLAIEVANVLAREKGVALCHVVLLRGLACRTEPPGGLGAQIWCLGFSILFSKPYTLHRTPYCRAPGLEFW